MTMELNLDNLDAIYQLLKQQSEKNIIPELLASDAEIEATPEKRQELNALFERTSGYLMEMAHIDSFLKSCDVFSMKQINPNQHQLIMKCQALCQSQRASSRLILEWVAKTKERFNTLSCPIEGNEPEVKYAHNQPLAIDLTRIDSIPAELVEAYDNMRQLLKSINTELLFLDVEKRMVISGRRLNVMEGRQLLLETEHELNVFTDYGLFQYHKEGKNIIQRYYNLHASLYTGKKRAALTALKETCFSLLKIIRPVGNHGLIVHDPLCNQDFLLIDNGLCEVAKQPQSYVILTHYLHASRFIMTTGASTPVPSHSDVGRKMEGIFNQLIQHHRQEILLDQKVYKQCITDLYKEVIHSDTTKTVASRRLPFDYHHLKDTDLFRQ